MDSASSSEQISMADRAINRISYKKEELNKYRHHPSCSIRPDFPSDEITAGLFLNESRSHHAPKKFDRAVKGSDFVFGPQRKNFSGGCVISKEPSEADEGVPSPPFGRGRGRNILPNGNGYGSRPMAAGGPVSGALGCGMRGGSHTGPLDGAPIDRSRGRGQSQRGSRSRSDHFSKGAPLLDQTSDFITQNKTNQSRAWLSEERVTDDDQSESASSSDYQAQWRRRGPVEPTGPRSLGRGSQYANKYGPGAQSNRFGPSSGLSQMPQRRMMQGSAFGGGNGWQGPPSSRQFGGDSDAVSEPRSFQMSRSSSRRPEWADEDVTLDDRLNFDELPILDEGRMAVLPVPDDEFADGGSDELRKEPDDAMLDWKELAELTGRADIDRDKESLAQGRDGAGLRERKTSAGEESGSQLSPGIKGLGKEALLSEVPQRDASGPVVQNMNSARTVVVPTAPTLSDADGELLHDDLLDIGRYLSAAVAERDTSGLQGITDDADKLPSLWATSAQVAIEPPTGTSLWGPSAQGAAQWPANLWNDPMGPLLRQSPKEQTVSKWLADCSRVGAAESKPSPSSRSPHNSRQSHQEGLPAVGAGAWGALGNELGLSGSRTPPSSTPANLHTPLAAKNPMGHVAMVSRPVGATDTVESVRIPSKTAAGDATASINPKVAALFGMKITSANASSTTSSNLLNSTSSHPGKPVDVGSPVTSNDSRILSADELEARQLSASGKAMLRLSTKSQNAPGDSAFDKLINLMDGSKGGTGSPSAQRPTSLTGDQIKTAVRSGTQPGDLIQQPPMHLPPPLFMPPPPFSQMPLPLAAGLAKPLDSTALRPSASVVPPSVSLPPLPLGPSSVHAAHGTTPTDAIPAPLPSPQQAAIINILLQQPNLAVLEPHLRDQLMRMIGTAGAAGMGSSEGSHASGARLPQGPQVPQVPQVASPIGPPSSATVRPSQPAQPLGPPFPPPPLPPSLFPPPPIPPHLLPFLLNPNGSWPLPNPPPFLPFLYPPPPLNASALNNTNSSGVPPIAPLFLMPPTTSGALSTLSGMQPPPQLSGSIARTDSLNASGAATGTGLGLSSMAGRASSATTSTAKIPLSMMPASVQRNMASSGAMKTISTGTSAPGGFRPIVKGASATATMFASPPPVGLTMSGPLPPALSGGSGRPLSPLAPSSGPCGFYPPLPILPHRTPDAFTGDMAARFAQMPQPAPGDISQQQKQLIQNLIAQGRWPSQHSVPAGRAPAGATDAPRGTDSCQASA